MKPKDLLTAIGQALYGENFRIPMSDQLGVADRTVRRWLAGTSPIPARIWSELEVLLLARKVTLEGLLIELAKMKKEA